MPERAASLTFMEDIPNFLRFPLGLPVKTHLLLYLQKDEFFGIEASLDCATNLSSTDNDRFFSTSFKFLRFWSF
jgi:hypothetical protein